MGICHEREITAPDTISHVIPATLINQVSKVITKATNLIEIDLYSNLQPMIEINYINNVFKAPAIDGKYPDFRRVIPETINNEIAQFDPEFLMQFYKCAAILNGVKKPDVAIGHNGTGGAIVDIQNGKFLGIIMPYRSKADFSSYKKPLWVDYAPAAVIEAPAPELQAA
jgi:DNA polymerase-3 subunit beta